MTSKQQKVSFLSIFKMSGAIIAFFIGSGFASGQEIVQFFTAYGQMSIIGTLISMALFSLVGLIVMKYGFVTRKEKVDPFRHFCGRIFGKFMQFFTPAFCFAVAVIMISGAGATFEQYFNLPSLIGTVGMSLLVLVSTMFGLRRLVDVIGYLGPLTIFFTIFIGVVTIIRHPLDLSVLSQQMDQATNVAYGFGNSRNYWLGASVLFVSYNIGCGIPFVAALGKTASSKKEAILGGICGGVALMLAALVLNIALLGYYNEAVTLEVPVLFLAEQISPAVSLFFSFILLGEIFSTAAPMIWTTANAILGEQADQKKYRILIFVLVFACLIGGQLPFGQLVGTIYPFSGFIGLALIVCVLGSELARIIKKGK
ncbi:YkvI family membrane protein [Enterococcus sp. AZ109]|uniref:YkvI family membrane protein n=1 Tax=Enterococcus sp. AZ109 TaxID=2774634 RepID=UPI003F234141